MPFVDPYPELKRLRLFCFFLFTKRRFFLVTVFRTIGPSS